MMTAYIAQRTTAPFDEAERITGIDRAILRKLVRDGVISGIAPYRVEHVVGECDINQAREIATRLLHARRPYDGRPITILEAAQKYSFSKSGLYDWIKDGWIGSFGTNPNGNILINEGDVAFAKELAQITNHRRAKKLFPSR